jgi:signal peptidase I
MQEGNPHQGYESHGMPGDVIIYKKNGGSDTPVIHRAILKAIKNESGGWDVPGTDLRGVDEISVVLQYECYPHGGSLRIDRWIPSHEGYLTTGDNEKSNGCRIDQLRATDRDASDQYIMSQGLKDENGNPVLAVKDEWVIGIASTEIPWLGSIKLLTTGAWPAVPSSSWMKLALVIGGIITAPLIIDSFRTDLEESGQNDGDHNQGEDE